jgi:hypothetical protein
MSTSPRQLNFRKKKEPLGALEMIRQMRRRNLLWYGVAILVSLLLHVAVILMLPGFSVYKMADRPAYEKQISLKLEEVKLAPEQPDVDRRPPKFKPDAARGEVAGEVGAEATTIRRAQDESAVEPRQVGAGVLIGEQRNLAEPVSVDRPIWEPRQEILSINQKVARDDAAKRKPRRYMETVPRSQTGLDISAPASREALESGLVSTGAYYLVDDPSKFTWGRNVPAGSGPGGAPRDVPPPKKVTEEEPRKLIEEKQARVNILKALEKHLKADVFVYRSPKGTSFDYCRIEIKRRTTDLLPVLGKDLLLVQDGSASITEQKLHFCREGLLKALDLLGPGDRFNVVEFRDTLVKCFDTWATVNPDTLQQAREFIGRMESVGNTDIFDALKDLLQFPRKPGRPVIMVVASDGDATMGITDHTRIIEAFSQANHGEVSVFTLGTFPGVNAYLLDLLSYRNRGDTFIVKTGRWDIPSVFESRVREVSRPVLSDVRFRFAGQTYCEAYPLLTANLYLDRPLVIYGRFIKGTRRLVFQATGQADDIQCDMVFDLDLEKAMTGDAGVRTSWAWQRAYYLIGEHTRTKQPGIITELGRLGKTFNIKIPYMTELQQ